MTEKLEAFNNRLDGAEGGISEPEDRTVELTQSEQQKE